MSKKAPITQEDIKKEQEMEQFFLENKEKIKQLKSNTYNSTFGGSDSFDQGLSDFRGREGERILKAEQAKKEKEEKTSIDPFQFNSKPLEERRKQFEAKVKAQEDAIKYEPSDAIEEIATETLEEEEYKILKDLKEERKKLIELDQPNKLMFEEIADQSYEGEEDRNIFEATGDYIWGTIYSAIALPMTDTYGMQDDNAKKLTELNEKIYNLSLEPIKKYRQELYLKGVSYEGYLAHNDVEDRNAIGALTEERRMVENAKRKVSEQIEYLDAIIEKKNGWQGIMDKMDIDTYTLGYDGMGSLIDELPLINKVENLRKIEEMEANKGNLTEKERFELVELKENNKPLTIPEEILLESMSIKENTMGATSGITPSYWYRTTQGTLDSAIFMAQIAATRGVGGAGSTSTKKVARNLLRRGVNRKVAVGVGKTLSTGTGTATQALAMPMTYYGAASNYMGIVETQYKKDGSIDKFYVRDGLYQKYQREISVLKDLDNKRRQELLKISDLTEKQKEELSTINARLGIEKKEGIMTYSDTLDTMKPESLLSSTRKGVVGTANELLVETVGGRYIDKVLGKFNFSPFKISKPRTKLGQIRKSLGEQWAKLSKGAGLNSMPSEYLEELLVAPLNALNDGNLNELKALGNADTHIDIIGQTALMGGAGGAVSSSMLGINMLKNKDFYKARKDIRKRFQNIAESVNDEDLANYMALNTAGSGFSIHDYKVEVEKLKSEGKIEEAMKMEQNMFYNLALNAFQTNTQDEFIDSLERASNNKNLSTTTRSALATAKIDIDNLKKVYDRYSKYSNVQDIVQLQSNKIRADKSINEINTEIDRLSNEVRETLQNHKGSDKVSIPGDISQLFSQKFEDKQEQDVYNSFLSSVMNEGYTDINTLQDLILAKQEIKNIKQDSQKEFNRQVSSKYQEQLKNESKFKKRLFKSPAIRQAVKTLDTDQFNKYFDQIVKNEIHNLGKETLEGIKESFNQMIAFNSLQQEMNKANVIKEKAEALGNTKKPDVQTKGDTNPTPVTQQMKNAASAIIDGSHVVTQDDPFDLPSDLDPNLGEDVKKEKAQQIKSLYEMMEIELGKKPSFKEFVKKFADLTTKEMADDYYNVLSLGWEMNNYSKVDFQQEYNEIFDPMKALADSIVKDRTVFANESRTEVAQKTEKTQENQLKKSNPVEGFTEENVPVSSTSMKTVTSELKLGFLAMRYTESTGPNGTVTRTTFGEELNSDGVIDFKQLLHPDKFNSGDLIVRIPPDSVLNSIYITKEMTYPQWLQSNLSKNPNFKDTKEYRSRVPMLAYSTDGTPVAYIHDVNWYNPSNIGYDNDPVRQASIIENGRKQVMELRDSVVNGDVSKITITEKSGTVFHQISRDIPAPTINETNPQAEIAIAKNRGKLYKGDKAFTNDKRVILNEEDIEVGHTYNVRRIGLDSKGRQTWMAFKVLRGDQNNNNRMFASDHNTIKWAYATFLTLSDNASYLKKTGFSLSKEKAAEIASKVLEETGYDISTREDFRSFARLYINPSMNYRQDISKLFDSNPEISMDFPQHTSIEGLGTNVDMIEISENGDVTPSNKKYEDYLKDVLRTDVKSFNIGTQEDPVYVTAIQPSIKYSYDSSNQDTSDVQEPTILEKAQQAVEQVNEDTGNSVENLKNNAIDALNKFGFNFDNDLGEFDLPNQVEDTSLLEGVFNTTEGMSVLQEYQLIDYLFNKISAGIPITVGESVNKQELLQSIKTDYKSEIEPSRKELKGILENIEKVYNSNPEQYPDLGKLIQQYNKVLETFRNIDSNWSNIQEKALDRVMLYRGLKEGVETSEDVSLREKDYSKSTLEEDGKSKTSYRLRRFFAGVEEKTPKGETKRGFLNLPTYVGFNEVYNTVAQIISSPHETESDFDTMIAKLDQAKETHKWLPDLIEKLKNADDQIKNEFVYNFTKHSLSMKFSMYSQDGKGNYNLKIYDTNAHEITRLIKDGWRNNFITTKMVNSSQELYSINKEQAKIALNEYNSWGDEKHTVSNDTLSAWLKDNFGIVFSPDAMKELREQGIFYRGERIEFKDMFEGNDTLFGLLERYLTNIQSVSNTEFEENENNHPFTDMGGVLQALASLESKYSNQSLTLSFRDNGKTINGLTPTKYVTDRVLHLKQFQQNGSNQLIEQLRQISISSDSYILDLLEGEESFRSKFGIDHNGITSLKQYGKKANPFSSITDLNSFDHDLAKFVAFMDMKQGKVSSTVSKDGSITTQGNGIGMRMGRMFLPTMSDKSQMLMLSTGVFNLFKDKNKAFVIQEGEVKFTNMLNNLLIRQLVMPELKRIHNFHLNVKQTNIKDYDMAAQIFNMVPQLNNIKDDNGIRVIELMARDPEVFDIEYVLENFSEEISAELSKLIATKVSKKMDTWESAIERTSNGEIKSVKFMDASYLQQQSGTIGDKFQIAMYDFVINSMISNANMFTILAGDPAIYSQSKLFKDFGIDNQKMKEVAARYGKESLFTAYTSHKKFMKELSQLRSDELITEKMYKDMRDSIKPLPYVASDSQYTQLSKSIGTNIGKRLALLIAPGQPLANSKNDKYMQLFLKDAIHMSENMDYLIELYYGKESLDKVQDRLDRYRKSNNQSEREEIRNYLAGQFPSLSDYFDIESTDAQEYTTVKEHLNILERQGRLSPTQLEDINNTLKEDKPLTKEQLNIVLQPIKPVYTGQVFDKDQDVMRTVYVKSSSFPLLPQLTKGRKLDDLRVKMEEIEQKNDMFVRASYQTANKVGAMNNAVDPFTEEGLWNLEESSLVLDRANFRIQQDVPFKSDKKKFDTVSMGTQIFKLLFGDGMIDQSGFEFNGETMDGKKLYSIFNERFADLIAIKKKGLFKELGLDESGTPIDQKESIEKLQDLLQREAKDRGYPRQDVEGLSFTERKDANGETYYDFKLPLWISSNSNRYESLLNAIVTNRIITQKIPGASYVVGSEEGFEVKEDMSGIDQSRIIHVGDYQGGELKGVQRVDGTFHKAQMLAPSKFKDGNGKLIDLYSKKKNGEYKYLITTPEGTLKLNEEKIDKNLLQNFTYRTPTSSHVSASIVEIVGILPPESGDLMIVPKNFTKQKGLDYDVDKENAYQLHHISLPNGDIRVLSEEHRDMFTARLRDQLNKVRNSGALPGNVGKGLAELDEMLLQVLGENDLTAILEMEETDIENKIERANDKFTQRLLENDFVSIHMSVFSNPNDEVQKKINKVLSMDFAKSQADFIEGLNSQTKDESDFTILSDEYQKEKMSLGAAGKLAIGVYSNYVTFHGLSQQTSQRLQLTEDTEDRSPKVFRIGNVKSDGVIGLLDTLDGERSIAEAFAEKQNTATDNEKEQVLGRVNVNGTTINVDSLLTLLGFDKGEKVGDMETSIPYLFLSQPIIKDYVKMMEDSQAITSDFNFNRDQDVLDALIEKYSAGYVKDPEAEIISDKDFHEMTKEMTSENMVNAITGNSKPGMQLAVLRQFLELDEYAKQVGSVQSILNTTSLGKSIMESNEKYEKLQAVVENPLVMNAGQLIGDFQKIEEGEIGDLVEQGYMRLGRYAVKPSTPQGQIVVNGIKTGNDLWNQYFPYSDKDVKTVIDEVMEVVNAEEKSDTRKMEMKFDIFKEIKRYLNSNPYNGLFNETAQVERKRLFMDTDSNQSLANYLNSLSISTLSSVDKKFRSGVNMLKTNKLFSKFEYQLNKNGEPSLVKFNNTSSENFDEDYLYNTIAELVINDRPLPSKNGKDYSTKKLAADMVAYAYLEGGVQEAIQFVKYVPIEYLETMGLTNQMQKLGLNRNPKEFKRLLGVKSLSNGMEHDTHTFVKQYIQHNPQMATQFNPKEEVKKFQNKVFEGKKLQSFTLVAEDVEKRPKFISRKNKTKSRKTQDKFSLYQHTGNGVYQRISILGTHGMNEYEIGNDNVVSLIETGKVAPTKVKKNVLPSIKTKQVNDKFKVGDGNARTILDEISKSEFSKYSHLPKVAEFLKQFVTEDLKVFIQDMPGAGKYYPPTNSIYISQDSINANNHEQVARTFIHEFIHSVTSKELSKYFDKASGKQLVSNLPSHISRLVRVFNKTKEAIGDKKLEAFSDKYRRWKSKQLQPGENFTDEDIAVTYAGYSIFEFVTTALTEPDFQKEMNSHPFMKSGMTIWEKFIDTVRQILTSIGVQANEGSITQEALLSTMSFIEKENTPKLEDPDGPSLSDPDLELQRKLKEIEDYERSLGSIDREFDLPLSHISNLPLLCR